MIEGYDERGFPLTEGGVALAGRIKQCRKAKGLTQYQLGKLIGVSSTAIMRYEKAQRRPKMETIAEMAQLFGVSVPYLMGFDSQTLSDKLFRDQLLADISKAQKNGNKDDAEHLVNVLELLKKEHGLDDNELDELSEDEQILVAGVQQAIDFLKSIGYVFSEQEIFHVKNFHKLDKTTKDFISEITADLAKNKKHQESPDDPKVLA